MIIVILLLNEHILTHFQSSRPLDVSIELHMRRAAAAAHAQCLAQTGAARVLRSAARAIDVVYSLTVSGVWLLEVTYCSIKGFILCACLDGLRWKIQLGSKCYRLFEEHLKEIVCCRLTVMAGKIDLPFMPISATSAKND